MIKLECSHADLPFQPGHSAHVSPEIVQLTAEQLLICSDLKDFYSATISLDTIIIISHSHKSFLARVEVYLDDSAFTLVNDALNLGDLLGFVKLVTSIAGIK